MNCPADNAIMEFLDGRLAPDRAEALRVHFGDCDTCRGRMDERLNATATPPSKLKLQENEATLKGKLKLPEPPYGMPDHIGPYRLIRPLGEGGMGTVYLAEQEQPLRRTVALKVIRAGMDSREVVARFALERQALALMSHPHIAAVLDAGSTDEGRPYFVMEYVAGAPIARYCDEHRLDARRRLELFARVCEAIQHAHQKGIIHRDIKPSNVLVTEEDGRPSPKVIDFGIAKATGAGLEDPAVATRVGAIIGTPSYMSPEQAEMSGDVDTTTDIYSLGVVLYELLVGAPPFDMELLKRASLSQLGRILRETEPTRPSARIEALGAHAEELAQRRDVDVATLRRQLRGDLEWIPLKAMEKDRSRRYRSASELAADVGRYLAGEALLARPPTARYRLSKFVARHRVGVAAAALAATGLVAGIAGTSVALVRARRAEAEAMRARALVEQQVAKVNAVNAILQDMLGAADPMNEGHEVRVVDVLGRAAREAGKRFAEQPELEAAVRSTLGATYRNLGDLDAADHELGTALALRRRVLGDEHPDTLATRAEQVELLVAQGKTAEAERAGRETLAARQRVLGPEHPDTLSSMNDLAVALADVGKYDECERLMRDTVAIRRRVLGSEAPKTLLAESNLAALLDRRGKRAEAEKILVEVLAAQRRVVGETHSDTLFTMKTLAGMKEDSGAIAEAEAMFREVLAAERRVSGPLREDTLLSENDLSLLLCKHGKAEEGAALAKEALETARRALPPGHRFLGEFQRDYGRCLTALGRWADAERELLPAYAALRTANGAASPSVRSAARRLVELYEKWGHPERAEPYRAFTK
jgi:serine/threonine protein kinase